MLMTKFYSTHFNVLERDVAPLAHPPENTSFLLIQIIRRIKFLKQLSFPLNPLERALTATTPPSMTSTRSYEIIVRNRSAISHSPSTVDPRQWK